MKKHGTRSVRLHVSKRDDVLLLDTNVWLYLNPAPSDKSPGTSSLSRQYSEAFKAMLSVGALLIMDALVLGEYLNRYCRIEWNALHKREHPCFKTFRKSNTFAEVGGGRRGFLHAPCSVSASGAIRASPQPTSTVCWPISKQDRAISTIVC